MKKQSLFVKLYLSAMLVFFTSIGVNAQVTIGSDNLPSQWSLLYLDASEQRRALHNARLTTAQRDVLVTPGSAQTVQDDAMGLLLFNTDTQCLEFWSGSEWVSLCDGDSTDPCYGFGNFNADFCIGATIDDLTALAREAGGRGTIHWFAQETDGTRLADNHPLTSGYLWADNCAGQTGRVRVWIAVVDCSVAPLAGMVTAWTTAMYDFQAQELSYFVPGGGGGAATSWQWYVNTNDGRDYQPIYGATSSTFLIPPNFMYSAYTNMTAGASTPNRTELHFRVVRENPVGNYATSGSFDMLFIRTTTSGFSQEADVTQRSLAISPNRTGGTIRIALLNLGATNDNSLGNMYQWGRRADGHHVIGWAKNPNTGANMFGEGTSGIVAQTSMTAADFNANGQVVSGSTGYGSFLVGSSHWAPTGVVVVHADLWGNSAQTWQTRTSQPASLSQWTARGQANNPCAVLGAGWRVPSNFDFWDMHNGNGTNQPPVQGGYGATASGNTWEWRNSKNGAFGGAIVTNSATNEAIFLPAMNTRGTWDGTITPLGGNPYGGFYWSSTTADPGGHSRELRFSGGFVNAGGDYSQLNRTAGAPVRCVQ